MKIQDIVYETAFPDDTIDLPGLEIECPECNVFIVASKWKVVDTDCESCGSHPVLMCPQWHFFDPHYDEIKEFKTRKVE